VRDSRRVAEMDLRAYFADKHAKMAELEKTSPGGVVYVTSLFNRERNSQAGSTLSATVENAARVITDGTHRLATQDEVDAFIKMQEKNREAAARSEQERTKQVVVFVDERQSVRATQGAYEVPVAVATLPVEEAATHGKKSAAMK